MARKTKNCNYDFIEIGFRGNQWISGCGKEILYRSPMDQGEASPPLPTDNGAKFCTFCGKPIRLTRRKPKNEVKIPVAPPPTEPEKQAKPSPFGPSKPSPFATKEVLKIDQDHNTYEGWQKLGLQVQRGEKSIGRDANNVPLFHRSSVAAPDVRKPGQSSSRSLRGDEPWPTLHYGGHLCDFDSDDIPY